MQLIKDFGIEPVLFVAQVINFLIILFVLKKFLYKPILDVIRNREHTIKKGLEDAQAAAVLLEKSAAKEKETLRNAQIQAKKLLEEARAQAKKLLAETQSATKKEFEQMLLAAHAQIESDRKATEKRLIGYVSELAISFLQKSLSDLFSQKEQEQVLKHALSKLRKKVD